jgi:ActR/RegA family two-component response regulator
MKTTIMVISPSGMVAALLSRRLDRERHRVVGVRPGPGVLRAVRRFSPGVVVVDRIDERPEAARLEIGVVKEFCADARIIALSGRSSPADGAVVEQGLFFYLVVPADEALVRIVLAAESAAASKAERSSIGSPVMARRVARKAAGDARAGEVEMRASEKADRVGSSRDAWEPPGWTEAVVMSWTLAGGAAGGLLATGLLLTDQIHPDPAFVFLIVALVIMGSTLGTIHGMVLGRLGRPEDAPRRSVLVELLWNVLGAVTGFILALLAAAWVTASATFALEGNQAATAAMLLGMAACLAACVWAAVLGWRVFRNAYARWPAHRLGTCLVLGAFAVLTTIFLALRPALVGTHLRVSVLGAVLFAAMATLWVAAPVVVMVTLRLGRSRAILQQRAAPLAGPAVGDLR